MELITDLNELNESHKNLINTRLKELISELNKTKQLENFSKTDFQDFLENEIKRCKADMNTMLKEVRIYGKYKNNAEMMNVSMIYVLAQEYKRMLENEIEIKKEPQCKNNRRKGRPKESFKDMILNDIGGKRLRKLHKMMEGKIGKKAALIILVAIDEGWISKPSFSQIKNEFGDIGTQQSFTRYLDKNRFTKEELTGAKKELLNI